MKRFGDFCNRTRIQESTFFILVLDAAMNIWLHLSQTTFITEENGQTMCIDCWNRIYG